MAIPQWLKELRTREVVNVVQEHPRTVRDALLGVPSNEAFKLLGGGQADFESGCGDLTPDDMALLYAYWLQVGHVDELVEAFDQHLKGCDIKEPIVIDLGCGPFTGGLAVASAFEKSTKFVYIGMDRSTAMRQLGERLAAATANERELEITRYWVAQLSDLRWPEPLGWRPVIVIASYLFASPTVCPNTLATDLNVVLERIGRGPVSLLHTNSVHDHLNTNFETFREELVSMGFALIKDEVGKLTATKGVRSLRYALFFRNALTTLELS